MIEPSWESIFTDCLQTQNIIFDIPVNVAAATPGAGIKKNPLIEEYLKFVSVERYIQLIRAIYTQYNIAKIEYQYVETGLDTTKLSSDGVLVFEIEKRFSMTSWSKAESRKYLFTVSFNNGQPKISSIRLSDPGQVKNEVVLVLDIEKDKKKKKQNSDIFSDIIVKIKIDFDEKVYNRSLIEKFDSTGKINLGYISNRATIRIDSAGGLNNEKFRIPPEWKTGGKKVGEQRSGGLPLQYLQKAVE